MSDSTAPQILVVEDEAVVAMDLQNQLKTLEYRIAGSCASGEEALDLARRLAPDLVLMDIHLQGKMDGIECGAQIGRELSIPVVYLTAHADEQTVSRAKATAPYGYILKPFDQQDLRVTLQIALHKHHLEKALQQNHKNLLAILDALRGGAILLEADGRVAFLSRSAEQLLAADAQPTAGGHWRESLPLSKKDASALEETLKKATATRPKIQVKIATPDGVSKTIEIEVVDDPAVAGRTILFLYDVSELLDLRKLLDDQTRFEKIVGESEAMQQVFRAIQDIAEVDSPVLIEGETGTGKELAARAIHERSRRRDGPFVAVNCGGLSEELAASQLFGHRRGAFTGAIENHTGYFETADGGTLFLDEISELAPRIQALLLRALEVGSVVRVGDSKPKNVDVRVLAATNRVLLAETRDGGAFRRDLYYRIGVARIQMPALRERRSDIPLLAQALLRESYARIGKPVTTIGDDALSLLLSYPWPGNVRELRNAVEYAAIRCRGTRIRSEDLPNELAHRNNGGVEDEAGAIRAALRQAGGNRKRAAALLGMSRATLYRRLEQYGLKDFDNSSAGMPEMSQ